MRFLLWLVPTLLCAQTYDIVLQNGRVMDPESGLDAVRSVGIVGNKIAAISGSQLRGKVEVDARNLVIAPGFIDLHQHSQTPEAYGFKAMDGVTTALELEVGVSPVSEWYGERNGKSLINFGASAGDIPARMKIMHDTGIFAPARCGDESGLDCGGAEGGDCTAAKRSGRGRAGDGHGDHLYAYGLG